MLLGSFVSWHGGRRCTCSIFSARPVCCGEQRYLGEGILAGESESVVTTVVVLQRRVHLPQLHTNTLVVTEGTRAVG